MPRIEVSTIYGGNTKKPIVEIRWPKPPKGTPPARERLIQLEVHEARDLAMNILQAAESAIQDAFIVEFFKGMGMSDQEATGILVAFRERRHDRQDDISA
jgi:hypothetical protein